MTFVCQLGTSPHRAFYVFCCDACPGSWRALRYSVPNTEEVGIAGGVEIEQKKATTEVLKEAGRNEWGAADDDDWATGDDWTTPIDHKDNSGGGLFGALDSKQDDSWGALASGLSGGSAPADDWGALASSLSGPVKPSAPSNDDCGLEDITSSMAKVHFTSANSGAWPCYQMDFGYEPAECVDYEKELRMKAAYDARVAEEGEEEEDAATGLGTCTEGDEPDPDELFMNFQQRVSRSPEQIIRHQWNGEPLWIEPGAPEAPRCAACQSERVFEFQILPTLLNQMRDWDIDVSDDLDFGGVYVYTCAKDCHGEGKKEFVIVQDGI